MGKWIMSSKEKCAMRIVTALKENTVNLELLWCFLEVLVHRN